MVGFVVDDAYEVVWILADHVNEAVEKTLYVLEIQSFRGFDTFRWQWAVFAGKPAAQVMEFEVFGVEGKSHFRKAALGWDFRQALCNKACFAAGVEHLFDGICPEQVEAVAG